MSKGVVETSDDFENMQINNNFGKFEQTSKFTFEVEMSRNQMNESENLFSLDESIAGIVNEMGKNVNIVANRVQGRNIAIQNFENNSKSDQFVALTLSSEHKVGLGAP